MKQWLATFAVVGLLILPVAVSADDDTIIPPEANWSSTPPTPGLIAVPQKRVVSTAQEQASDSPRPAAVRARRAPAQISETEARYQAVNPTVNDD